MASLLCMKTYPYDLSVLLVLLLLSHFNSCAGQSIINGTHNDIMSCIDVEREALLKFNCWSDHQDDQDCCQWDGVQCDNSTGHVVRLEIHDNCVGGKVSSSLVELKHLEYLDLSFNDFKDQPIPSFIGSLVNLKFLALSGASFKGRIPDQLLANVHSLEYLDLSINGLEGPIPQSISNLKHLAYIDLSSNNFQGSGLVPRKLGKDLCSLHTVSLSRNNLTDELSSIIQSLSGCAQKSFRSLDLSTNMLSGSVPDLLGTFSALEKLDLSSNQLNGTISPSLGQLSKLQSLYLYSNSLRGMLSHQHLSNLSNLQYLELFDNPKLVVNISDDWLPPFQLDFIDFSSCKLGTRFPKWLLTQTSISYLDISNTGISDAIPASFWNSSLSSLSRLNMSHNQISGMLPDLSATFQTSPLIDLSSNRIEGSIPSFLREASTLLLNNNMFSNVIPFFCPNTTLSLSYLDLSNNLLSGEFPNCWMYFNGLTSLLLENNNLSGNLPPSIGELTQLHTLQLRNNNISGLLPTSLQNCKSFVLLDLSYNSLTGYIPPWIGSSFKNMTILSLRSNNFLGDMPSSLCEMPRLQILDLSVNHISGKIPKCIGNLTAMINTTNFSPTSRDFLSIGSLNHYWDYIHVAWIMWKRAERSFMYDSEKVKAIDISGNELEGQIPEGMSNLVGLVFLNLSRNHLTGSITPKFGQLTYLESLDLSNNQLYGEIPTSLTKLNSLGILDLSNNNLSGRIPHGTQLQGFGVASYMGNPELCGDPLPKCQLPTYIPSESEGDEKRSDDIFPGFYLSVVLGFIVGFWGVCGTLVIKRSWRHAYFRFVDDMNDKLYVMIIVNVARIWKKP